MTGFTMEMLTTEETSEASATVQWDDSRSTTDIYDMKNATLAAKHSLDSYSAGIQIILGILMLALNSLVLVVLRKVSTLTKLTRFLLSNLAMSVNIFGGCFIVRGIFILVEYETKHYCAHLFGLGMVGAVSTHGTISVMTANMLYVAVVGVLYNEKIARNIFAVLQLGVWVLSFAAYGLIFLFLEDTELEIPVCSPSSGFFRRQYFQIFTILATCFGIFSLVGQIATGIVLKVQFRYVHALESSPMKDPSEIKMKDQTTPTPNLENLVMPIATNNSGVGRQVEDAPTPGQSSAIPRQVKKERARETNRTRQYRHSFKIIATVSLFMLIFTGPNLMVQVLHSFAPDIFGESSKLPFATTILAQLTNNMNVVIYVVKDASFRSRILKCIRCSLQ